MATMHVTAEALKKADACDGGLLKFVEVFGKGAAVTPANVGKAVAHNLHLYFFAEILRGKASRQFAEAKKAIVDAQFVIDDMISRWCQLHRESQELRFPKEVAEAAYWNRMAWGPSGTWEAFCFRLRYFDRGARGRYRLALGKLDAANLKLRALVQDASERRKVTQQQLNAANSLLTTKALAIEILLAAETQMSQVKRVAKKRAK